MSLEELLEHSRKSDELYAESLRDERLRDVIFFVSVAFVILALPLVWIGLGWARWLPLGGLLSLPIELIFLAPRRRKRLEWYKANNDF